MDWIIWIVVLLVIVLGIVGGIVAIVKASAKTSKADHALLGTGAYGTVTGPDNIAGVQPHVYAQGMNHRSASTTFGVIGLFVLGIVFGPLALVQAGKAQALGVKATTGKVLGWISVGFAILWLVVFVGFFTLRR